MVPKISDPQDPRLELIASRLDHASLVVLIYGAGVSRNIGIPVSPTSIIFPNRVNTEIGRTTGPIMACSFAPSNRSCVTSTKTISIIIPTTIFSRILPPFSTAFLTKIFPQKALSSFNDPTRIHSRASSHSPDSASSFITTGLAPRETAATSFLAS